jgi:tRNA threonylcarbamoyladenosine biosynthesis protein TsaE
MYQYSIHSIAELDDLALKILTLAEQRRIFIFKGNLGTGKTTLIKSFCKLLGVKDETSSPTYSIVNEYLAENKKVYHIDLYRLNSLDEALEVGLEDYLDTENYCFIEWPQIAEELLPEHYIAINIEKLAYEERQFNVQVF